MKLELRNVACGYDREHPVLTGVNFTVETGEICCLLGPNGVGKTTLFKTILSLLKPLEGSVLFDGENTASWPARTLARNMAYVSQFHTPPFPYRVRDVVLLGRVSSAGYFGKVSEMDYSITEAAMRDMGLTSLRERPYTDLSGGERQLVMIARALAQQPKLLVLDEPTANLDYGNMLRVMNKICALRDKGLGIIMTTHSPDQAFLCRSTVSLLQRGGQLAFGDAEEVITQRNMRQAYGVEIRVAEFPEPDGSTIRVCLPELE